MSLQKYLYVKEAVGKRGKTIKVPKLRTMCNGAENMRRDLISKNARMV